ncbi:glycoside hydrolase family 3 C-terminal domain-containing protein [uncultured Draconibacterium sp.]|uniref:beta-glucosidase family protein n=1 Tax=uncultured Draconibacterium sp. TaxID=1573823 RepID=UPI003260BF0C
MKLILKKNTVLIAIIWISFLYGCSSQTGSQKTNNFIKSEQFADSLISILPLKDKVGLLHGMGGGNSEFGDLDIQFFGIKGNKEFGIPPLYMGHGITGVRSGRDTSIHATYFCTPIAMGCSWNPDLYSEVGGAIAKEMRALGQDLNLGPTLNIIRHPLGGRNWESFSEDPFLTTQMGVSVVKAMQSNGIVCGPKHFVANNQEHNRFDINNEVDERTLREIYLPAFKAAVTKGGALNIMGAYNRLNGYFMCHNKYLLNDILRGEWGFNGFVLSDFANGIRNTVEPVNARMNVEMHRPEHYGTAMLEAVERGIIKEQQVDTLLKDVLKVMYTMDLFKRERYENPGIVHSKEHIQLCRKVAQETPVLLKNENKILPIDTSCLQSISVIGPNAKRFSDLPANHLNYAYYLQGGGSGRTYYFHDAVVDPFDGIVNALGETSKVVYAKGCQTPFFYQNNKEAVLNETEENLIAEAVVKAKESEIAIVYAGLSGFNETEGWDRKSTSLPGQQNKLIQEVAKVNSNTIVVITAGSAVDVEPWIDDVKAVLFVPYCGEQIGNGIADILTGKVSPSGKLPFTWAKSINDYPKNSIFKGLGFSEDGVSNQYSEGIFVGYRYFDKKKIDVRFPFGYGLSYTQFDYSDLKIQNKTWPVKIELTLKNMGKVEGAEIVQLYVSDPESEIEKAINELKAFDKIVLKPGETQKVAFELEKQAFSHYDVEQKEWLVDKGEFIIKIGSSSRDLKTIAKIEL